MAARRREDTDRAAFFYPPISRVFDAISRYNSDADPEPAAAEDELWQPPGRDPVAEALIARAERAVAEPESQNASVTRSEGAEAGEGGGLEILDVLDAMASHYGETTREMLKFWSWKLFCRRWERLVDYMEGERAKRRDREREEAFERLRAETAREHQERPPVYG